MFPKFQFVVLFLVILSFQSCGVVDSQKISFSRESTVQERFGEINCLTFSDDSEVESCSTQSYGLLGSLHYLEDRTDGVSRPATLFDANGNEIPFTREVLHSVDVILQEGFESDFKVLMPQVFVPSRVFSDGFKLDDGNFLTAFDKPLMEAFALDLHGKVQLNDKEPGFYIFGLLSDDGSVLDLDVDADGKLETLIDNDGYHGPTLMCSDRAIYMDENSKIPMRLRYYQGPRQVIALNLIMKKVEEKTFTPDALCGAFDSAAFHFFGEKATSGYTPELVNSPFGELMGRGWFVPDQKMFLLPDNI